MTQRNQTDGAIFVVHKQPIALDRFTLHDVRPPDAAGMYCVLEYLCLYERTIQCMYVVSHVPHMSSHALF